MKNRAGAAPHGGQRQSAPLVTQRQPPARAAGEKGGEFPIWILLLLQELYLVSQRLVLFALFSCSLSVPFFCFSFVVRAFIH